MHSLNDVTKVPLQQINQELAVLETGTNNNFTSFQRLFYLTQQQNAHRGRHAHKAQKQLLICLQGSCDVICDDGTNSTTHTLLPNHIGLYIPPGIWGEQIYLENNTILLVACDAHYDEDDYIRDYQEFLAYRDRT